MAYIVIEDILTIGATKHTASSYEFYLDEGRTELIEGAYGLTNPDTLREYHTPLFIDGKMYDGTFPVYGRVRVKFGDRWEESWHNVDACTRS